MVQSFKKSSNERECTNHFSFNWKLSFMSLLFYWEEILEQINLTQKKLQESGIDLNVRVTHMDAMKIFFNRNRDRLMAESVNQNKTKCLEMEIPAEKRIKTKRKLLGDKRRWCMSDTCVGSKEKSLRMSLSTCKWTGSTIWLHDSSANCLRWIIIASNPGRYWRRVKAKI